MDIAVVVLRTQDIYKQRRDKIFVFRGQVAAQTVEGGILK